MWNSLQYIIPSLIVFITAYFLIDRFFRNEEKNRRFLLKKQDRTMVTPIILRAYERLTLFLERITPQNIIINKVEPNMSALQLHQTLLSDIRKELEHNFSQQIYVSQEAWEAIVEAKENITQLINLSAAKCDVNDPAEKLAEVIIKVYDSSEQTAIDEAKVVLKKEVTELIG